MKRIQQDIKSGQLSNIYLIYGAEAYLRKQYRDKLKEAIVPGDDSMNCSIYSGKDINVSEIIDIAGTMPFFAERRLIIVENSGLFKISAKNAEDGQDAHSASRSSKPDITEKLADFFKNIPQTSYIVFVEEDADKRGKLYKAVTSKGYAAVCESQDEETLKKWILSLLKKENKAITADAMNLLLDKTGANMENIRREVEKLVCYKYFDEGIKAEDVEEICTVQLQNRIFDMVEAVAAKDQQTALALYYDLLALKEAPIKILALITRQFNMLLQVKEMKQKGYPESEIAKQTGLNPYYLKKKYIPQAQQFKLAKLEESLKACVEADESVKTGKLPDKLCVELLIISLSEARH